MDIYKRCWSQMVPEILDLILQKLDLPDYFKFAKVCTSWRSVFLRRHSISRPPPCMVLIDSGYIKPVEVLLWCLHEGQFLKLKYPRPRLFEGRKQPFVGCSMGWLVVHWMFDYRLQLMNPVKSKWIYLPSFTSGGNEITRFNNICHVVMSAAPTSKDCILVARGYLSWNFLAFAWCRLGEHDWTIFRLPVELPIIIYIDMVFHKGALYILQGNGEIYVYAFSSQQKMIGRASVGFNYTDFNSYRLKLVEECEELFCVLWELGNHGSMNFYVYRMLNYRQWTRVHDLDDRVFLISEYSGRSYFKKDLMGSSFEANCIYWGEKLILKKFCMADRSNQEISLPPGITTGSIEWIMAQAW